MGFSGNSGTQNPLALPLLEQLPSEATDIASRNQEVCTCLEEGVLGLGIALLEEEATSASGGWLLLRIL